MELDRLIDWHDMKACEAETREMYALTEESRLAHNETRIAHARTCIYLRELERILETERK